MFSALKYHAVDYLHEKMAKQRFSFEWLSIHIPSCLYQDKNYYHDGVFDYDKYRRPWTRVSLDANQIVMNFSVLDHWRKCLYIEDFLEKKPTSSTLFHIHNEDIEIVPSSNPCSQFDIEDAYVLMKDDDKEEFTHATHLRCNYVTVVLKEDKEGLYIEDELVFIDSLTQYAKRLPTLHMLLSRLNIFHVQDPFLNCKGDNIIEEDIFRECFTFKTNVTSEAKEKELKEEFCKVPLRNEEILVLPIQLQSYKTKSLGLNTEIPTGLALKSLLQVTQEIIGDENESLEITSEDLRVKITPEIEISEYCPTDEVGANESRSALELSKPESYTSFHPGELEVPLTPPSGSEKVHVHSLYAQLQSEPVSPFTKSNLITESTVEYLEGLVWQSEKYQNAMNDLLLADHQTFVPICQQFPVTELKTLLSVHEEISVFSHLEKDEWIKLTETGAVPCVLEALSTDLSDGEGLVCTNVEAFSKITTSQLGNWLERKNSFANNRVEPSDVPDYRGTMDSCLSPQKKEILPPLLLEPIFGVHLQYRCTSTVGNNASTEENISRKTPQKETRKQGHFGNQEENDQLQLVSCREVLAEANNTSGNKMPARFELPRTCRSDFDLLSNFIMLRSQHKITQNKEANNVDVQEEVLDAEEESPTSEKHNSPVTISEAVPMEKQTRENEEIVSIQIKASVSQFQAYHILEAAAAPVLKELLSFCMHNWKFATLNFDITRFFLKQQEKVIRDAFNQGVTGTKETKDTTVFKYAGVLHLLVTVRDLLLTCNLNTALGYLFKAKDRYKDFLDFSLDNIWRLLKIVQIATQKHEANPKITELYHQMSRWVQSNMNDRNKVVIVTRMDFDEETDVLINTISAVQGLKIIYLDSEKRGTLLESKNVTSSLEIYSCVVVYNQNIGPDFPWSHFSLVVEYNYSENSCWINHCKNLNVSYITFITTLPEAFGIEEVSPDNFGCVLLKVQIPYVFLMSEGLLNTPEILQLLESKYSITFIERSCCEGLQFFGRTDHYVVVTIDECTAIIMQNMEELSYEKSSDNIMLRLMVLSLQYSSCWIILYSRERLNSEYSLSGKTLHNLALIYAALVLSAQKSEDFEVKAEKCLLTFPCMNPLVAQVMLKKSSSLEWLLSATFEQLHALLPDVPEKVLKHFRDITSLYTLKPPIKTKPPGEIVSLQENMSSPIGSCSQVSFPEALFAGFQGHSPFTEYSGNFNETQKSKSCSPDYCQNASCIPVKSNGRCRSLMAPSAPYQGKVCSFQENTGVERQHYFPFLKEKDTETVSSSQVPLNSLRGPTHINSEATMPSLAYNQGGTNTYFENGPQNRMCHSKLATGQKLDAPVLLKNPIHQGVKYALGVKKQPLVKQHNSSKDSKRSWYLVSNREHFPFQQSTGSFLELSGTGYSGPEFQLEKRFGDNHPSVQAMDSSPHDSSFCKALSSSERFFNSDYQITGEYAGNKMSKKLSSNRREHVSTGLEFIQLPQLKKRRLTFEKDPGRSDGQTRLKFF
ncbi:protein shortage in chiasmata 1 ortholog isoform X2 [Rhineura floridana]|uniref:protein shortage in chiasmata 1 ortholog isoform X2 n=1 Tax=Rhineura floridana TaxID=261503 RepID=UPI002AC840E6|nr:protein shortage in chiasmata 1 ortholog isoform X2 [Rhineura floridana]